MQLLLYTVPACLLVALKGPSGTLKRMFNTLTTGALTLSGFRKDTRLLRKIYRNFMKSVASLEDRRKQLEQPLQELKEAFMPAKQELESVLHEMQETAEGLDAKIRRAYIRLLYVADTFAHRTHVTHRDCAAGTYGCWRQATRSACWRTTHCCETARCVQCTVWRPRAVPQVPPWPLSRSSCVGPSHLLR